MTDEAIQEHSLGFLLMIVWFVILYVVAILFSLDFFATGVFFFGFGFGGRTFCVSASFSHEAIVPIALV